MEEEAEEKGMEEEDEKDPFWSGEEFSNGEQRPLRSMVRRDLREIQEIAADLSSDEDYDVLDPDVVQELNGTSSDQRLDAKGKKNGWTEAQKKSWLETQKRKIRCLIQALQEVNDTSLENHCPRVWDKILCWPPTPPETRMYLPCYPRFPRQGNASRFCDSSGNWSKEGLHPTEKKSSNGWSNYTECLPPTPTEIPHLIGEWLPTIKKMSMIGYSISLITLAVSFSILISLRKLRCPRNILHLHLFASFMLRATVVLLKGYLVKGPMLALMAHHNKEFEAPVEDTAGSWWCKLVVVVWQYFILANYSWILMEGLYLHNLIFLALFSDSSAITLYIILGWGLPLFFVVIWSILRSTLDDLHCWTINDTQWIFWVCIRIPVALSNFVNFFFFLNVTRVLILKLRSSVSPESMKYRKLGKSTLVLVPLFGVHYFLLWGLSTSSNVGVELAWLFLDQVFASFQGFFVAVLYCLMNGEVRQELRKIYHRYKGESYSISQSTVISHSKTYLSSRGRSSVHSTHSASERKGGGLHTPSPQKDQLTQPRPPQLVVSTHSSINSRSQSPETMNLTAKSSSTDLQSSAIEMEPIFSPSKGKAGNHIRSDASSYEEETPLLFVDDLASNPGGRPKISSTTELVDSKQVQPDLASPATITNIPSNATSYGSFDHLANDETKFMTKYAKNSKDVMVTFDPISQSVQATIPPDSAFRCDNTQSIL